MIEYATLTPEDKTQIVQCRGIHNRLGFAYQIAFARLMNSFPAQQPFEIIQGRSDGLSCSRALETSQVENSWKYSSLPRRKPRYCIIIRRCSVLV
ncbi:DUF4158 domain-containing protein [Candidatus Poribacteria bacterium]|nr:DUF4158 domain-containing protein [Candidatus Poribacteria bacterium]